MPVVVEDGSVVANANSYVTRSEYIAQAATIGVTIPNDATADAELVRAAEYIDAHAENMKGRKLTRLQPMAFPRSYVVIEDWAFSSTEIPPQLKQAQMAFALDVHSGIDLYNQGGNPNLMASGERVEGAVSVQYHIGSGRDGQKATYTSRGEPWLRLLLRSSGSIQLVRA